MKISARQWLWGNDNRCDRWQHLEWSAEWDLLCSAHLLKCKLKWCMIWEFEPPAFCQFLQHDALHKRCRALSVHPSVCPSVCLSVMFVYSVEMNEHIFNFFPPSGSHIILVLPYRTLWQYSNENPQNWGKIAIFDQCLALASISADDVNISTVKYRL